MKKRHTDSTRASALQIALLIALLSISAIVLSQSSAQSNRTPLTPVLGNYPNTSLALSTNTTVTPDTGPTNTARINVSTSTNFKGRLEGYPASGVVRVTDAHPAGIYTVTVKAFDSGGASATTTFTLTVTTPATCNPVRFAAAVNFGSNGGGPYSVAVGDFNGDGKQDLAVLNSDTAGHVSILLGNGAGGFSAATNFAAGFSPTEVAVGDFNGDGNQDLAVAKAGGVSIWLGNGAGSFSAAPNVSSGSNPSSITVGDFNGDGNQDLVAANYTLDTVSIWLGNGAGGFSAPTNFAAGNFPGSVAVGDFNGDGNQDLAVASDNVSILLGNGAGSFSAPTNFAAGDGPRSVAVGDFNGDGKQDLAVTNDNSGNVSILLGDGTGHFEAATNFAADGAFFVAVGDFNGDGKQDLAVANFFGGVLIFIGNGAGSFSAPTNFVADTTPVSVAVGDFNGDGKQDLAVANYDSNDVSILLGNCALAPTGAFSRKTHGAAGTFYINLPLTGTAGVECRIGGGTTNDFAMVVSFAGNVTVTGSPQAQVTMGVATIGTGGVSNGGMVSVVGSVVTVPLTNVADQQTINVTLNGVSSIDQPPTNVVIPMSRLLGDTSGNRAVNAVDVTQTKGLIGQAVTSTNFRCDVNANGAINAGDASLVKASTGHAVP